MEPWGSGFVENHRWETKSTNGDHREQSNLEEVRRADVQFLHLNLLGTLWESQACKPQPQLSRTWAYQDHKPPGEGNPGITWSQMHGCLPTCPVLAGSGVYGLKG